MIYLKLHFEKLFENYHKNLYLILLLMLKISWKSSKKSWQEDTFLVLNIHMCFSYQWEKQIKKSGKFKVQ